MRAANRVLTTLAVCFLLYGCASQAQQASLYERLGGKPAITAVVCAGTGGPCTYTGRDMRTVHTGMGVSDAHFNGLVKDLVKTLDKFKVPQREKDELLAILGPMKTDIVMR